MNALDGLRVIDLSHAISGPTCTNMLVQLGADVVKVEPPETGDGFRHYTEHAGEPFMSVPFAAINAGKKSITLDLKSAAGRDILLRLIDGADVLVENFRPGVLARLGVGQEVLRARNPRLVTVSITGFGQEGPLRDWGAYDHIAQAISGIALMNATQDGPQKIGMPIIDSFAGYLAVIGLFAALRRRDVTGHGEHVDVAMLDAALKLVGTSVSVHSYTGKSQQGTGNRGFRLVATSEFYRTADGWIALGANHQTQIAAMFRVFGHAELIEDPRFSSHAARVQNYAALKDWLTRHLLTQSAAETEAALAAAGVPVAMLREVGEIVGHPHIAGRGLLRDVNLPGFAAPLAVVGPGFATDPQPVATVPTLGGDTDAILAQLGFDAPAISDLHKDGVV
jgi:CoA:oxalate CoA-transferase